MRLGVEDKMIINNNMSALKALGFLKKTDNKLNNTIKKLSTGLRINQAADDAAGLSISEVMRSRIKGMEKASQNTQDGISMLQTAEGALGETQNILQRMRELAVQAANDTLTSDDRYFIQLEISGLKEEINHIAKATNFNNKKLLDGTAGAIWSSNDLSLRANMKGGITSLDQFGQKINSEGNYNIEITATPPGQAQVLKSNILETVSVSSSLSSSVNSSGYLLSSTNLSLENLSGTMSGNGWSFANNTLTITGDGDFTINGSGTVSANNITIASGVTANVTLKDVNIDVSGTQWASAFSLESGATANIYLSGTNTLTSGKGSAGLQVPDTTTVTISSAEGDFKTDGVLNVTGGEMGAGIGGWNDYVNRMARAGRIEIWGGTINAHGGDMGGCGIGGGSQSTLATTNTDNWGADYEVGSNGGGTIIINGGVVKATGGSHASGIGSGHAAAGGYDSTRQTGADGTTVTITGGVVNATGGTYGAGIGGGCHSDSGIVKIRAGLYPGSVTATAGSDSAENIGYGYLGKVTPENETSADIPTASPRPQRIKYIKQFFTSEGSYILDEPQKLTITQGGAKSTDVMLYRHESVGDIAKKINDAIANDLGQKNYTDNSDNFCVVAGGTEDTSESVPNTLVIRSAVAGKNGELSFTGSEQVLKALGLNTIQEAVDTQYNVSIKDAHTGKSIADNIVITGNKISGVIHENLEIEFDAMAGTSASWDNEKKLFNLSSSSYTGTLHLANRGITFQTGADHGDEVIVNIGDMSTKSLGVDGVNVSTRELAAASISLIDRAADTVITQRAKLGAYIGTLGHTIENLANEIANLSESESRIRDADMAKETMELVELQILVESGTSMLSQANQTSQAVLSLVNGR